MTLIVPLCLAGSCMDKQLTTEAASSARGAHLVATFQRRAATSAKLRVTSVYLRSVGDSVTLYDQTVPLTNEAQQVSAIIDLSPCLDDPQRTSGGPCAVGFRMMLRDSADAVIDSTELAPTSVRPGGTLILDASPPAIIGDASGVGIRNVSVYAFSTSPATAQTYEWNFGDGTSAGGATASHVYSAEGAFVVTLKAQSAQGVRVARRSVTIGSLTGTFERDPVDGISHQLQIVQVGNTLTGTWNVIAAPNSTYNPTASVVVVPGPLSGSIASPRSISLAQGSECLRTIAAGSVSDDLSQIGGNGVYGNPNCGNGAAGGAFFFHRVSVPRSTQLSDSRAK